MSGPGPDPPKEAREDRAESTGKSPDRATQRTGGPGGTRPPGPLAGPKGVKFKNFTANRGGSVPEIGPNEGDQKIRAKCIGKTGGRNAPTQGVRGGQGPPARKFGPKVGVLKKFSIVALSQGPHRKIGPGPGSETRRGHDQLSGPEKATERQSAPGAQMPGPANKRPPPVPWARGDGAKKGCKHPNN